MALSDMRVCCAISDQDTYDLNLGRSSCLQPNGGRIPITIRKGWPSVPAAYNSMIAETEGKCKYRVFAHQDVFLPPSFIQQLSDGIRRVEKQDPQWDVVGVAGVVWVDTDTGTHKMYAGRYRDRGLDSRNEVELPCQVETVDEVVVVTQGDTRFDEKNPFHHLMAADLCWRGRGIYCVDAWCSHSCKGKWKALPMEFAISAGYMFRKHYDRLPLTTNCATIQSVNGVCSIVA